MQWISRRWHEASYSSSCLIVWMFWLAVDCFVEGWWCSDWLLNVLRQGANVLIGWVPAGTAHLRPNVECLWAVAGTVEKYRIRLCQLWTGSQGDVHKHGHTNTPKFALGIEHKNVFRIQPTPLKYNMCVCLRAIRAAIAPVSVSCYFDHTVSHFFSVIYMHTSEKKLS